MNQIKKRVIKEDTELTEKDVVNSYDFRIACEIIQSRFPWIKDCVLDSKSFNNKEFKQSIWIDYVINPFEVMKEKGWKFGRYTPSVYYYDKEMSKKSLAVMFDIPFEEGNNIMNEIRKIYMDIANTKVIPQELKIPRNRVFVPGDMIIPPGYDLKPYMYQY